jgi:hypothetical protein
MKFGRIFLDGGAGAGTGAGEPTPTPQAQPEPTPPQGEPEPTAQVNVNVPPGYVPAANLQAVVAERDRLAREAREREEATAKEEGRWQELAEKNETRAKAAEERVTRVARRSAFVSAASKAGVTDPEAAYKLALADGLLNDVNVDADDNADAGAIAKALEAAQKTYKFLKRDASFGGERGGQPEADASDPNLSTRERMRRAYSSTGRG